MPCKQLYRLLPAALFVCLLCTQVHGASSHTRTSATPVQNISKVVRENINQSFAAFTGTWLQHQAAHALGHSGNPEITRARTGIIARVVEFDSATGITSVEPTGDPAAPYIGTITYMLTISTSKGKTPETALAGPFIPTEILRITEIFLYRNGVWGAQ